MRINDRNFRNILNSIDTPFTLYEWGWDFFINRSRRVKGHFYKSTIEVDTIVRHLYYINSSSLDQVAWDDIRLQDETLCLKY